MIVDKRLDIDYVAKLATSNKIIITFPDKRRGYLSVIMDAKKYYGYVYLTINLTNDKIYVGKRKFYVKSKSVEEYLGSGKLLNNAIKKYGRENFKKIILEYCPTKNVLNRRERFWISFYEARNCKIGYNISEGGDWGEVLSSFPEDVRLDIISRRNKSIREALKGVPHTEERNSKKSDNWHKQKDFECQFCHKFLKQSLIKRHTAVCKKNPNRTPIVHSEESKQKIRLKSIGKKHSEKTKSFLSSINRGELNPSSRAKYLKRLLDKTGVK